RHRLAEIVEDVAHAALAARRHPVAIGDGDRTDEHHVDRAVQREDEAVGDLDGIPRLRSTGIVGRTTCRTERGDRGEDDHGLAAADRQGLQHAFDHPTCFGTPVMTRSFIAVGLSVAYGPYGLKSAQQRLFPCYRPAT